MENALYYTFSTIAQALAGAIALLAAFVLFKLQNIDSEVREHSPYAIELFAPADSDPQHMALRDHCIHGRWDQFLAALPPGPLEVHVYHAMHVERMRALRKTRAELVSSLKAAVPLTLGTMVAAVFVLVFVPALKDCLWWSRSILGAGAIAFAGSIFSYRKVIRALFE